MTNFFKKLRHISAGQTLVEIVVVIGVVVILTTGLIALTTFSLKNSRISGLRSQAVTYAAEGMEFVRQRRDTSWADFQELQGTWCLGDSGAWVQAASCAQNVNGFFGRSATFTWNEVDSRMAVTVTVSWTEGASTYETHLDSYFTQRQ